MLSVPKKKNYDDKEEDDDDNNNNKKEPIGICSHLVELWWE